jgi:prepilin-type N-terminal cleavage/methylation domain-containing protein
MRTKRPVRHKGAGFTLVELVIVIVIIGILVAIATPRFIDLRTDAWQSSRDATIKAVRTGLQLVFADCRAFPPNLEAAFSNANCTLTGGTASPNGTACAAATPCFELLMDATARDSTWTQTTVAAATSVYTFDPDGAGSFPATTCTYTVATGTWGCIP